MAFHCGGRYPYVALYAKVSQPEYLTALLKVPEMIYLMER